MLIIKQTFLLSLFILLASCSGSPVKIYSDRNPEVDISSARTFAWLKKDYLLESSEDSNPIIAAKVARAIEVEMRGKGYELIDDPEMADLTVTFTVGSREKVDVHSFPVTYGGRIRWGYNYYGPSFATYVGTETRVIEYTQGELAIDIFDVKTRQPAWHGHATKRITSSDEENRDVLIKETVGKILSDF